MTSTLIVARRPGESLAAACYRETEAFKARCATALTVAQNTGAPAWKIEGLKEALAEAQAELDGYSPPCPGPGYHAPGECGTCDEGYAS